VRDNALPPRFKPHSRSAISVINDMSDQHRGKRRRLDVETSGNARRESLQDSLQAGGFHHQADIRAHYSCVNALASNDRYLATAGDDLRVLLYDTFASLESLKPLAIYTGPRWNIFSLSFTTGNKLLSSGNERKVSVYDLEGFAGGGACQYLYPVPLSSPTLDADLGVRTVRAHPEASQLAIATSTDSSICIFDLRAGSEPVSRFAGRVHFSDAHFHPGKPYELLTADEMGSILLLDQRNLSSDKLVGSQSIIKVCLQRHQWPEADPKDSTTQPFRNDRLLSSSTRKFLLLHSTRLAQHSLPRCCGRSLLSSMWKTRILSLCFRTQIIAIAALPKRVHWCRRCHRADLASARFFVQHRQQFDVRWRIRRSFRLRMDFGLIVSNERSEGTDRLHGLAPPRRKGPNNKCVLVRELLDFTHWLKAFTQTKYTDRIVPINISKASKLQHHRSIVNSTFFHPSLPLLFSSGVEKMVKVWSAGSSPKAEPSRPREMKPFKPRFDFRTVVDLSSLTEEERLAEDTETLQTFDYLQQYDKARSDLFSRQEGPDLEASNEAEHTLGLAEEDDNADAGL
jgi:WD40 repeat protein